MTDTKGICCTANESKEYRFFLFELDGKMNDLTMQIEMVIRTYLSENLDYIMHRTKNGVHFLSPTIITKKKWNEMFDKLHILNPRCPMLTMRWLPNKYPNENEIWFHHKAFYEDYNIKRNSKAFCSLLNVSFGTHFKGSIDGVTPKMVTYQL